MVLDGGLSDEDNDRFWTLFHDNAAQIEKLVESIEGPARALLETIERFLESAEKIYSDG